MVFNFEFILITLIILLIDFYSEIQLKNDGSLLERFVYLIGVKSLFNLFKFVFFFSLTLIFFNFKIGVYLDKVFDESLTVFLKYGFTMVAIVSIFIVFYNSNRISRQFRINSLQSAGLERMNQFIAKIQYIIYRIISFSLVFWILYISYTRLSDLNYDLISRGLGIWDWIKIDQDNGDNYNKGVYFSMLLTAVLFFIFNNAFLKKQSDYLQFRVIRRSFFKYFFISLILGIGLFFGFFSIFNGIYNLLNSGFNDWVSQENILGILPIRVSAVFILIYLLTYIYKQVLHKELWSFLKLGLLPIRYDFEGKMRTYIDLNNRETLFFCQISFYILNLSLAEYFIINGSSSTYLSLLNFSILFILDDYKLIDDYTRHYGGILKSHFLRLTLFNIMMIVVAIIILLSNKFYLTLTGYVLMTAILLFYYLVNLNHYRLL